MRLSTPWTHSSPARRRLVLFAWVLVAAQLFGQLHALEHVDAADEEDHAEEVCSLCILGSNLANGGVATAVASDIDCLSPLFAAADSYRYFPLYHFYAFAGRGPPAVSSLV